MEKLLETVKNYIDEHGLLELGDKVVIGLSGGVDSVALLSLMNELYGRRVMLYPIYVHHHIRDDADADVFLCNSLCEALGCSLKVTHVDVPAMLKAHRGSEEQWARNLRYEAFENYRAEVGGRVIAVAHHKEDQAETILLHMIRGAGGQGLAGMSPQNGRIIRPLLKVSKEDLVKWVEQQGLETVHDSTNDLMDYTRNRIRMELLPYLKEHFNPNMIDGLTRLGELFAMDENYLEGEADRELKNVTIHAEDEKVVLDINRLNKMHPSLLNRVLRLGIKEVKGNVTNIEYIHLMRLVDLIGLQSGKQVPIADDIYAKKEYNHLIIEKGKGGYEDDSEKVEIALNLDSLPIKGYSHKTGLSYEVELIVFSENGQALKYKDSFKNGEKRYTNVFDYDKIKTNLIIRTRRAGDRIQINKNGDSKRLKKFFIDEKIPSAKRKHILVLSEEDNILWIVGYRNSEGYKVTGQTKRVLRIQLMKGDGDGIH